MKPEEQGLRSHFGPSNEDLTDASKQVRTACSECHACFTA